MNKVIYLDNNATTRVAPEVFEAMRPFFCERYGNPSSIHRFGGSVAADLKNARNQVAELLGVNWRDRDGEASEIIFTSCGTEGDNTAINAALRANPNRNKILASQVEHPGVLTYLKELQTRGYEVELIPVDGQGKLDLEFLKAHVDGNTALVSTMWANNETGTIFPIGEICRIAHQAGALFHTDAVQAAGKEIIEIDQLGVDFLSLSGHKLHAPKGVGALFAKRSIPVVPFLFGGHQERMRRGGTENVASVIGLGKAAEIAKNNLPQERIYLASLRDRLEKKLLESVPQIRINGDLAHRLPNTSSVSFECIEGESILMYLDMHNICASSGSACTTGSLEPSHVLRAMNIPYSAAHGTIRFSLSKYNTAEEIDYTAGVLPEIISTLRKISPYWKEK